MNKLDFYACLEKKLRGSTSTLLVWIYSGRPMIRTPDNTNSRYVELKFVPLGLINPYKNTRYNKPITVSREGLYYRASTVYQLKV